jgi:hypothetical protein
MRTDGHDELKVAFYNFANALKNRPCSRSQAMSVTYLGITRLIRERKERKKERKKVITSDGKIITSSVVHPDAHNIFLHVFLPNPSYMLRCVKNICRYITCIYLEY